MTFNPLPYLIYTDRVPVHPMWTSDPDPEVELE